MNKGQEDGCRDFPFNPVTDVETYKEKVHKWVNNYEYDTYFHWVIEWKENHELIGTINLGNVASAQVLTKCGMLFEGIARQKYYKNSTFIDTAQYAVLKSDL